MRVGFDTLAAPSVEGPKGAVEKTDTMNKQQKVIRCEVGLLEQAQQLDNVRQACRMMGCLRDSIYWFKELYEWGPS